MFIDARGKSGTEPLEMLREALRDTCSVENDIIMLVDGKEEARQVKIFASMTYCPCEITKKEDHYELRIERMCNCG